MNFGIVEARFFFFQGSLGVLAVGAWKLGTTLPRVVVVRGTVRGTGDTGQMRGLERLVLGGFWKSNKIGFGEIFQYRFS